MVTSYPSVIFRHGASPSWHSSSVVKLDSSTLSTGDTRGGAGGGEQLPQHSPSAEPSLEFMASRAKPGWMDGVPNTQGSREPRRWSEVKMCLASPDSQGSSLSHLPRSLLPPKPTCAPLSPVSNFLPRVSFSFFPCSNPPDCKALQRSRISVSFDYRGWVGDVSQAWLSLLMSWHSGSLVQLQSKGTCIAHALLVVEWRWISRRCTLGSLQTLLYVYLWLPFKSVHHDCFLAVTNCVLCVLSLHPWI